MRSWFAIFTRPFKTSWACSTTLFIDGIWLVMNYTPKQSSKPALPWLESVETKMFKAIRSYLRTNAELTSLLNEATQDRWLVRNLLEIANADADYLRAENRTLRDQAATHIIKIASLQQQAKDTSLWIADRFYNEADRIFGPGTADANGVPLADETECKVIQFKRTIQ